MGSSAITPLIKGKTGPTGPQGPKGPIGSTGTGTGFTGNTGIAGLYVTNVVSGFFETSDLSGYLIEGTIGPTGYTGTMFGQNLGNGLTLYSALNGFTLSVRGLTFIGNLSAEVTGGTILITPTDVYYGVTLASGIQNNRVLYSKTSATIDSTRIQLGKTHTNFIFSMIQGITPGSLPVYSEMSGNVIDVPEGGNDIILGLTQGSIYKIHTPLGLSGFTLTPSLYGDNELLSFTLFIEGRGFSQFPPNVYFKDTPYSSVFGCGTNIMNLMTYDKGQNWYATISDRGYGVSSCETQEGVGSCCYMGPSGEKECAEYVSSEWCDEKTDSVWKRMEPCEITCREKAICCVSGRCVEGVNKEECEYFLGKYYKGFTCIPDICSVPDGSGGSQIFSCCTGGTCINDVTPILCMSFYGGISKPEACSQFSCVDFEGITGACCVENPPPGIFQCSIQTFADCSGLSGIFYGPGSECDTGSGGENLISCCFDGSIGSCCVNGTCYLNQSAEECSAAGGTFYYDQTCGSDCSPSISYCCTLQDGCIAVTDPGDCEGRVYTTAAECITGCSNTGTCCLDGSCLNVSAEFCENAGGNYYLNSEQCDENCGTCCVEGICNSDQAFLGRNTCESLNGTWRPKTSCGITCGYVFCCENGCAPTLPGDCGSGTLRYDSQLECATACAQYPSNPQNPIVNCCVGGICRSISLTDCNLMNGRRFSTVGECRSVCGTCCIRNQGPNNDVCFDNRIIGNEAGCHLYCGAWIPNLNCPSRWLLETGLTCPCSQNSLCECPSE